MNGSFNIRTRQGGCGRVDTMRGQTLRCMLSECTAGTCQPGSENCQCCRRAVACRRCEFRALQGAARREAEYSE
eukprot:7212563-Prymnesium_polylepis.1